MSNVSRVFIRGDTHGNTDWVPDFCKDNETTKNDVMIILGDSAFRFEGPKNSREIARKSATNNYNLTFFILRGNHDRPYNEGGDVSLTQCPLLDWSNPPMWHDPNYPNLWYFQDGEKYTIKDKTFLTVGGAYSVDKFYRLSRGWTWYEHEQLESHEFTDILDRFYDMRMDYILTHTCPISWEPTWLFMSGIDQSTVDKTTEHFLEDISRYVSYNHWYFGHFHDDHNFGCISPYIWNGDTTMLFNRIEEICNDDAV